MPKAPTVRELRPARTGRPEGRERTEALQRPERPATRGRTPQSSSRTGGRVGAGAMTRAPVGPASPAASGTRGIETSGGCAGKERLRPLDGGGGAPPKQFVELLEGPGAHRHARGHERRDRVEGRLEALSLPVEADDERLALAEDGADPAAAGGLRPVLDEDADAVLPGPENGRAQVERPVRLAEDGLRAAFGRRRVGPARGVRVEAGAAIAMTAPRVASSSGGAARAIPPGPRRARGRGPRAGSRAAGSGSGPAPPRRGRSRPRRRR